MPNRAQTIILAAASALTLGAGFAAHAASTFDGRWAVRVVAETATCDDDYSVSLRISEGRVSYGGLLASASGRVRDDGKLTVTVSGAGNTVKVSGALKERRGSGRWQSPNCAGKWTASKA